MTSAEYCITNVARCGLARCGYWEWETEYEQLPIYAVAYVLRDLLQDYYALRCGHPLARCGSGRLGLGTPWPLSDCVVARVNLARCGASYCGRNAVPDGGPFAGMRPAMQSRPLTMSLTEEPGGPADPRQAYGTAYDNPAYTLHITGDEIAWMDALARYIREELDMTTHLETPHGDLNGLRIGPAKRINRTSRPRYELVLGIQAEYIRPQED